MRPECRPRDLEIQVVRAAGMGGPARSALKVRNDEGTGSITFGSGRMGSKDPVVISGCMSWSACRRQGRRRTLLDDVVDRDPVAQQGHQGQGQRLFLDADRSDVQVL